MVLGATVNGKDNYMQFRIPFAYNAKYCARRHRLVLNATLLSEVAVDILEVDAPDAPAFELGCVKSDDKSSPWIPFRMIGGRRGRTWRLADGGLYAEYCPVGNFIRRVRSPWDNPLDATEFNWSLYPSHNPPGEWESGLSSLPFDDFWFRARNVTSYADIMARHPLRLWIDDGGAYKAGLIAQRLSDFRIIAGMVCVPVGEPVLIVTDGYKRIDIVIAEDVPFRRYGLSPVSESWWGARFPLDRLAEAEAFAADAAHHTGKKLTVRASIGPVRDAPAFLPVETEHLVHHLWELCRAMYFRTVDPAVSDARKLVEGELGNCTGDYVSEAVVTAFAQFAVALRQAPPPPRDDETSGMIVWLLEAAEHAIAKWRARTPSPEEWPEEALPISASKAQQIFQVTSLLGMREAAMELDASIDALKRQRTGGNILLRVPASTALKRARSMVAVVSPNLEAVSWLGYRGLPGPPNDPDQVCYFLLENARRRDELDLIGDIEF